MNNLAIVPLASSLRTNPNHLTMRLLVHRTCKVSWMTDWQWRMLEEYTG